MGDVGWLTVSSYVFYCHRGSFSQPEGNPRAARSISGNLLNKLCILSSMSLLGEMMSKEILDDAHVIIYSSLVRRNSNPRTSHASHIIWNNLVDLIPNTSMMTTRIASKRNHRKPRLKHWSIEGQETLGDLAF